MTPIDLFVPGRLCLFGEHSDWAGMYRTINSSIEKGLAIVTGIEQGIYATAERSDKFIMCGQGNIISSEQFECEMDTEQLIRTAQKGGYFSYVAGVASYMKDHYSVGGVKVTITKRDIPIKSGLSSSAAICVLVARAFNQLYDLKISIEDEMRAAFRGEHRTPSRCGRLDQACAFGKRPVLMEFDGEDIFPRELQIGGTFYLVVANLMSSKNTIKILRTFLHPRRFKFMDLHPLEQALVQNLEFRIGIVEWPSHPVERMCAKPERRLRFASFTFDLGN